MPTPLLFHDHFRVKLRVSIHDMNFNRSLLHEPVNAVNRLNEVVEFVGRPDENRLVTMSLKIATAAQQLRFAAQNLQTSVRKV